MSNDNIYTPNGKCKICKLYNQYESLWLKIHAKVLQDGLARKNVCDWANTQIEVENKTRILRGDDPIAKLSAVNFQTHFTNHIPEDFAVVWAMQTKTSVAKGPGSFGHENAQAANNFIRGLASEGGEAVNSFNTMQSMVDSLEIQINAYTEYFNNYSSRYEGKLPDIRQFETYQKLIAGYLQSKQEIMKIKNSNEITGKAIESALWKIASELTTKVKEVTELARVRLQDILPGTSVPVEIENQIKMQFAEYAKMIVPSVMDQIKKEYGLK